MIVPDVRDMLIKVQNALIKVVLFLIYFVGIGISFLLMLIFKPGLMLFKNKERQSMWHDADGDDEDLEHLKRQS